MRAWLLVVLAGCGRIGFDPLGDPFQYGQMRSIYLYNDVAPAKSIPIEANAPISTGGLADFAVAPDLEANTGLTFDPQTGVISGSPTRTSPSTTYTVTATLGDVVSTARVTIRTAPGFYVTDLADLADASPIDNDCVTATGTCTLRAALRQLAVFDTTLRVALVVPPGTIQLGLGELVAMRPVEIIGTGRDTTAVDAAAASRVLDSADLNTVIVSDLTLRNGKIVGDGGGAFHIHGGNVVLRDLVVEGSTGDDDGGVSLFDDAGMLPMQGLIERVVFRNNTAILGGGALGASSGAGGTTVTITECEFTGNTAPAGAALSGGGRLIITESLFADNNGNAIFLNPGSDSRLINDTIVGNHGGVGTAGGIGTNNVAIAHIINSTVVGNTCAGTCFGEGGIGTNSGGIMTIRNTIVAGNLDLEDNSPANCHGAGMITSLGNNLADDPGTCFDEATGDRITTALELLPLGDYGGPTRTIAIGAGSPAYDGGSDAECPSVDQRGFPRPAQGSCDIGAFEAQ